MLIVKWILKWIRFLTGMKMTWKFTDADVNKGDLDVSDYSFLKKIFTDLQTY